MYHSKSPFCFRPMSKESVFALKIRLLLKVKTAKPELKSHRLRLDCVLGTRRSKCLPSWKSMVNPLKTWSLTSSRIGDMIALFSNLLDIMSSFAFLEIVYLRIVFGTTSLVPLMAQIQMRPSYIPTEVRLCKNSTAWRFYIAWDTSKRLSKRSHSACLMSSRFPLYTKFPRLTQEVSIHESRHRGLTASQWIWDNNPTATFAEMTFLRDVDHANFGLELTWIPWPISFRTMNFHFVQRWKACRFPPRRRWRHILTGPPAVKCKMWNELWFTRTDRQWAIFDINHQHFLMSKDYQTLGHLLPWGNAIQMTVRQFGSSAGKPNLCTTIPTANSSLAQTESAPMRRKRKPSFGQQSGVCPSIWTPRRYSVPIHLFPAAKPLAVLALMTTSNLSSC